VNQVVRSSPAGRSKKEPICASVYEVLI
jgi:hypothetical protein